MGLFASNFPITSMVANMITSVEPRVDLCLTFIEEIAKKRLEKIVRYGDAWSDSPVSVQDKSILRSRPDCSNRTIYFSG